MSYMSGEIFVFATTYGDEMDLIRASLKLEAEYCLDRELVGSIG